MTNWVLPRALLLDEGGVLSVSDGSDAAPAQVAALVRVLLDRAGIAGPDTARIEADIVSGKNSYRRCKAAQLTDPHPREVDHRHFWRDLVAESWPVAARTLVELESGTLSRALSAGSRRRPAPAAEQLLAWSRAQGIRIALVANTFAAGTTRRRLACWGLDRYFAVQVHSDETGFRKPDLRMITTATTALDLTPDQCWFVGDSRAKDVECGRRAGVAVTVLVRPAVDRDDVVPALGAQPDAGPDPDLRVAGCAELLTLLRHCAEKSAPRREESTR